MKKHTLLFVAALGLGFAACTAEAPETPADNTEKTTDDGAKATTVSYKIDGMT